MNIKEKVLFTVNLQIKLKVVRFNEKFERKKALFRSYFAFSFKPVLSTVDINLLNYLVVLSLYADEFGLADYIELTLPRSGS